MATCIHCGKSGKKICDTCLEKAKKGKLTFLFPLKNNERTTITDACKPKLLPAKVVVSPQTPQPSGTNVEKAVPKEIVVKEEPKSTEQVKNTSTAVAPVAKKNTSSSGSWGWRIVVAVLIGLVVSTILLPWNIGQWIVGVPIALLMIICFLIFGFDASFDDEFVVLDIVLYVLTTINIVFMNIWEIGYSTLGFVASIGLAVSSLFVMARAYYEMEAKQGHWALLCTAINVALIFWDKIYVYIEPIFTYIKGIF